MNITANIILTLFMTALVVAVETFAYRSRRRHETVMRRIEDDAAASRVAHQKHNEQHLAALRAIVAAGILPSHRPVDKRLS